MKKKISYFVILIVTILFGLTAYNNSKAHDFPPQQVVIGRTAGSTFQVMLTTLKSDLLSAAQLEDKNITKDNADLIEYFKNHIKFKFIEPIEWKTTIESIENINDKELFIILLFTPNKIPSSNNYKLEYTAIIKEVQLQEALISINAPFYAKDLSKINTLKYSTAQGQLGIIDVNYSMWDSFLDFVMIFKLGMFHILGGIDHLMFLLIILVHSRSNNDIKVSKTLGNKYLNIIKPTLISSVKIVGLYTIGHTISLTLASFGVMPFDAKIIEVLVAITLLVSALMAIFNVNIDKNKWLVVLFGLIHGFAFSEVLREMSIVGWQLVMSVISFNLGIEFIQLVIIAITTPIIIWLTKQKSYPILYRSAMVLVILISIFWIYERTRL
jgi:HupE / UreJ protein